MWWSGGLAILWQWQVWQLLYSSVVRQQCVARFLGYFRILLIAFEEATKQVKKYKQTKFVTL